MKLAAAVALAATLVAGAAQAETCMKSGEEKGALGTVCYYRCSFGDTTVNVGPAALCPLTTQSSVAALNRPPRETGGACLKQGERSGGMTKECIYDCAGTRKVVTIGAAQLCPLTAR